MGDSSESMEGNKPQVSFKSKELELLLDMIDTLRARGISRFIDLPQMVVCGDQSSGKSSVLEAVSGVRFPTKDNLCTRFPTELILRRHPEISTSISIVPDASRSNEEKKKLEKFKAGAEGLKDFGATVELAAKAMGLDKDSKVFSNDVLRVELTGPKLPHLTLVDLPGLFHAGNKNQSADDAEAIKALVTKYMKKSRSIILAVVSAKNDYANQIVTKYARDVDPTGERTLGIITKPDTLYAGSESEKQFFELAENKDVVLRLGWHVLKNRDFNTKDCTADERDEAEAAYFAKGIWTALIPSQLGIGSLKPRLGRVLRDQILTELPGLTKDVESGIKECEARLARLGGSRATKSEQRTYLHRVSQDFCKIVQSAVKGYYTDPYFHDSSSEGYPKRIRAIVSNTLEEFASTMTKKGRRYVVLDEQVAKNHGIKLGIPKEVPTRNKFPIPVSHEERLKGVAQLVKETRGQELPGFTKFETITTLFREQCYPWEEWARYYAENIFDQVRTALLLALDHTSDQMTKDSLLRFIINPGLDEIKADLDRKVTQNLQQHVQGHPITFNHYFTENLQKLRNGHEAEHLEAKLLKYFGIPNSDVGTTVNRNFAVKTLAAALGETNEADMNRFACSEALHYMEAYYKVALKFFVDDFSIHTIEQGLLEKLEGIFDPGETLDFTDERLEDIAGESDESKVERASSSTKLAALKEALKILRQLDRGRPKV